MSNRFLTGVVDLLFPRRCLKCGKIGDWACCDCCNQLPKQEIRLEMIGEQLPLGAFFDFQPGLIRELLHNLKYNSLQEVADVIVEIISQQFSREEVRQWLPKQGVLIPVPVATSRLKQRGYNQAELLAISLGKWLDLPVWPQALRRQKQRGSQVGRSRQERQARLEGVFVWSGERQLESMRERQWVLVDDVCTTGATLQACAQVLRERALLPVSALVVAKKN